MSRTPIDREGAVLEELRLTMTRPDRRPAYCTATTGFSVDRWNGDVPVRPGMSRVTVRAGETLKVVRMMRHGDLGIGDADGAVVQAVLPQTDDRITDIRWTTEPTNFDPQAAADQQFDAMMDGQDEEFP